MSSDGLWTAPFSKIRHSSVLKQIIATHNSVLRSIKLQWTGMAARALFLLPARQCKGWFVHDIFPSNKTIFTISAVS